MSKRNKIIQYQIDWIDESLEAYSDESIEHTEPEKCWKSSKAEARYQRKILREIKLKLQEMKQ